MFSSYLTTHEVNLMMAAIGVTVVGVFVLANAQNAKITQNAQSFNEQPSPDLQHQDLIEQKENEVRAFRQQVAQLRSEQQMQQSQRQQQEQEHQRFRREYEEQQAQILHQNELEKAQLLQQKELEKEQLLQQKELECAAMLEQVRREHEVFKNVGESYYLRPGELDKLQKRLQKRSEEEAKARKESEKARKESERVASEVERARKADEKRRASEQTKRDNARYYKNASGKLVSRVVNAWFGQPDSDESDKKSKTRKSGKNEIDYDKV